MTTAYMGVIAKSYIGQPVAAPQNADVSSGMQKSAAQAVIGSDAAVVATQPFQAIGGAVVADGFVAYVPPIPT